VLNTGLDTPAARANYLLLFFTCLKNSLPHLR